MFYKFDENSLFLKLLYNFHHYVNIKTYVSILLRFCLYIEILCVACMEDFETVIYLFLLIKGKKKSRYNVQTDQLFLWGLMHLSHF